jgi:DNA polymerase-3 subunit delta'
MLAELDKHPHAKAVLSGGNPSHAYLFYGPGGSGKREIARQLAAEWLADGDASARTRALHGSHPDMTWVSPSGAHEILVRDIDGPVIAAATRTPFESARRVFVIESVDQLGDEAANRMLKTLEEPASFVHMILITDHLGEVMPTIRSRCQLVRFDGVGLDELAGQVGEAPARLGFGDAGRSRELTTSEGVALRAAAEGYVRAILAGTTATTPWRPLLSAVRGRGDRLAAELESERDGELDLVPRKERKRVETEWTERIKRGRRRVETEALDLALSVVDAWLLDLAALCWGAPDLVRNVDRLDALTDDQRMFSGTGYPASALIEACGQVEETRTRFQLNVTEELALEALAYKLERHLTR